MHQKFAIKDVVSISIFAALTGVLSFLIIPVPAPIPPITGQSFAPMLAGILLGPKKGAMSQLIYVLLGFIGLPIFSGGRAGPAVLFGERGGYLLGFIVGCFVIGLIHEKVIKRANSELKEMLFSFFAVFVGGVIIVYILGVSWLMFILELGLREAVMMGALPFLVGDIVKVIGAVVLARSLFVLKEKGVIF